MAQHDLASDWHIKVIKPRLPWGGSHPRAAEVGEVLCEVMLSREFSLEDAEYQKIVPNEFVVELNEGNYLRNYQPIEERVLQQWRSLMLEQLATANNRLGRSLYRLGSPLNLKIHPVADLKTNEIRILCRVQRSTSGTPSAVRPVTSAGPETMPCLEMLSGEKRWFLRTGTVTIGRDERCTIHLNMPEVQDKRLVSGEHAYLRSEQDGYLLFDGSQDGKASVNGTFVNRQPVPLAGHLLKDGDEIILASLDPVDPRPDTKGVVVLRFREACS
jgi:hypothetical protein